MESTTTGTVTTEQAQARARETLRKPYSRCLIPQEEGGFSAEILEFPGCFAEGETADETYRQLESAAEEWLIACLEKGDSIPPPLTNYEISGRFALRLPLDLYARAAKAAAKDGVSLNQFIVNAVAERVGIAGVLSRVEDVLGQLRSLARLFCTNVNVTSTPGSGGMTTNVNMIVSTGGEVTAPTTMH